MEWLPGTNVTDSQPDLIVQLVERRTRPGYSPLEAMRQSRRVDKEFLRSPFFSADQFLIYHERHNCPRLNRLHVASREELLAFLNEHIRPERSEGADLTVTTFAMAEFLLTNHDGDMWSRRPAEWPDRDRPSAEPLG